MKMTLHNDTNKILAVSRRDLCLTLINTQLQLGGYGLSLGLNRFNGFSQFNDYEHSATRN